MTVQAIKPWMPAFTAREARLLLDHLDNTQAASLEAEDYRVFRAAKAKLVDIETAGKR